MDAKEQFCDDVKKQIEYSIENAVKPGIKPKDYHLLMDRLKTALYNHHHVCYGPGDKFAALLPPSPHQLAFEADKVIDKLSEPLE